MIQYELESPAVSPNTEGGSQVPEHGEASPGTQVVQWTLIVDGLGLSPLVSAAGGMAGDQEKVHRSRGRERERCWPNGSRGGLGRSSPKQNQIEGFTPPGFLGERWAHPNGLIFNLCQSRTQKIN